MCMFLFYIWVLVRGINLDDEPFSKIKGSPIISSTGFPWEAKEAIISKTYLIIGVGNNNFSYCVNC